MDIIWLTRNQTIHNSSKPDITKILCLIHITFYNHENVGIKLAPKDEDWQLPPPGTIKENYDVNVRKSSYVASALISDDKGNMIVASTAKLFFLGSQ
jgi:hypothetical protein